MPVGPYSIGSGAHVNQVDLPVADCAGEILPPAVRVVDATMVVRKKRRTPAVTMTISGHLESGRAMGPSRSQV